MTNKENNIDLDIKNYSIYDLETLFSLSKNYIHDDIIENKNKKILKIKKANYEKKLKETLIDFFENSALILKNNLIIANKVIGETIGETIEEKINSIKDDKLYLTTFPTNISKSNLNNLRRQSLVKTLSFNTLFRNNLATTISTNCDFNLPIILKDVIALKLSSIEMPCSYYTYSNHLKNNIFYIKEDILEDILDNNFSKGFVEIKIPEGNYSSENIAEIIGNTINNKLNSEERFEVNIDSNTGKITILNTVNKFSINFNNKIGGSDNRKLYKNFGWTLGFRKDIYRGSNSYTSESIYNSTNTEYFYFSLNDYNISNCDTVIAIFEESFLEDNLLAKIPINVENFQFLLNNNSDFISKRREFFGPVNIQKLSIKLYNKYGEIIFLNDMNYSFSIEFELLYDL